MQAEALAAVRVLRDPAQRRVARAGCACSMRRWHQGVVGLVASRRQGAPAPTGDRLRARRRAAAARLGALDARRSHPRRARCDGHARAAADPEIRRPRDGRGTDARGRAPGSVRARLRRGVCAGAGRARLARRDRDRRRARARGAGAADRARRCAPAGPGARDFPSRCSMACFDIRSARLVGERHLKLALDGARGTRRVRCDRVQLHRRRRRCRASAAARAALRGWSIGWTATSTWASGGCSS